MANFKFRNSWSDAARTDPRFRDPPPDVGQVVLEQSPAAEIAAAELPRAEASAPPATSPWVGPTSIMAGRRRPRPWRKAKTPREPAKPKTIEKVPRENRRCRGVDHHRARFTDDDIREMRRLHREEGIGARRLAPRFGAHHQTIQAILDGRHWAHVT